MLKCCRTHGIVIKTVKLREADLFLTVLTADHGRLTVLARNIRNSRKRFMGGIDLFDCGSFDLGLPQKAHGPYTLQNLDSRESWPALRNNLQKYSLASFCLEVTLHFAPEDDIDAASLFPPLYRTLRSINSADSAEKATLFALYYNLFLLSISGYNVVEDGARLNRLPELKHWLSEMLRNELPIMPFERPLLKQGLQLVALFTQEIIGRQIQSLNSAVLG
ncbi:MAG: DNA repair protein RecO [Bdellovibrionota bacterium]